MELGKEDEQERGRLESRRKSIAYELPAVRRHFRMYLSSERLKLTGIADLVLEMDGEQKYAAVEFKSTYERLDKRHQIQLAAYSALLAEKSGMPVKFGYLVTLPSGNVTTVAVTETLLKEMREARDDAAAMLEEGTMPAPADRRAKCRDCEFKRFCNDIW